MDLCLKQWRDQQHESDSDHQHQQHHASALPLFATDHDNNEPTTKLTNLSAFPPPTRLPRMGSYLSLGQRQELEVQALIYRHMLAGATVPPQLLHLLNKTLLLNSQSPPPYYLPQPHYHHPPLVESGYWGRGAMDPEPGRCRRTDGKKWRCSRDVVGGHKYCDRHMHRGRNRSRKPVEITKPTNNSPMPAAAGGSGSGTSFGLSGPSPSFDILQLHQRPSESIYQNKDVLRNQGELCEDDKSSGRILRHFFNDWPTSVQQHENASSATTSLSISVSGNTFSSDFSLKLSTGNGDDEARQGSAGQGRGLLNWGGGSASWGTNQVGGPLAEALRLSSTTSNSSPTSVLQQMQRGPSTSEASYITT